MRRFAYMRMTAKWPHADPRGTRIRTYAVTFHAGSAPDRFAPPHPADWHQLIYAARGAVHVKTARAAWVLPPHRALWIPEGIGCQLAMRGETALRMLYVRAGPRGLFKDCAVVNVPPLLRELILRANASGALVDAKPEQRRLTAVILDELRVLQRVPLQLPWPVDPRAAAFAELASAGPRAAPPVEVYCRKAGASRRTLERLFRGETELSLGQWLRRRAILEAVRLLGEGHAVAVVAEELGYGGPSAFIAMFRRELGQTPARYMQERG